MRLVVQILAVLNLLTITVCVVAGMWMGQNPEGVPTWEYLTVFPIVMTCLSPFLALTSVVNHRPTLVLLVLGMPPVSLLMLPMLFIKRDLPST